MFLYIHLLIIRVFNRHIVEDATAVLMAGGVALALFYVGQRFFGLFSYPGLAPEEVDRIAKEYDTRFKILSRVQGGNYFRGVYEGNGHLYYYRYTPGRDFSIYPLVDEFYTTRRNLLGSNPKLVYP